MSKLREAAQAVVDIVTWRIEDVPPRFEWLKRTVKAVDALRAALAEDRLAEMQALTESDYGQKNLAAAVLAEREACAAICDGLARRHGDGPGLEPFQAGFGDGAWVSADKIRARGQG